MIEAAAIETTKSSPPATGQTPRLISARSRRKLGGATAITPFGSLAGSFPDFSRIMRGWCASEPGGATGNSRRPAEFHRSQQPGGCELPRFMIELTASGGSDEQSRTTAHPHQAIPEPAAL